MRKQALVLREIVDEAFDGSSHLHFGQSSTSLSLSIPATNHSIFAHEHDSLDLPFRTQTLSDLMHLLRADIINGNDEDRLVPDFFCELSDFLVYWVMGRTLRGGS